MNKTNNETNYSHQCLELGRHLYSYWTETRWRKQNCKAWNDGKRIRTLVPCAFYHSGKTYTYSVPLLYRGVAVARLHDIEPCCKQSALYL